MKLIFLSLMAVSLISCTNKSENAPASPATSAPPTTMQDLPDPGAGAAAPDASLNTGAASTTSPGVNPPQTGTPKGIEIAAADRACKKDSDCALVRTHCSCHCGEGVNAAHLEKYTTQAESVCKDYAGPMCKVLCNGEVKCVDKVCSYVP
jgi:hypothetical protein